MKTVKSLAGKALALALALLLPLPGFAVNAARQAPATALGVAPIGTLRMPISIPTGVPGSLDIPQLPVTPGADAARAQAAIPAMPAALSRNGALDVLNTLQARGINLPETAVSHNDAARLRAAAEAMPEGALRSQMFALAHAARMSGSGPGDAKAFNAVYDLSAAMAGESVWTKISRWPFIPSGLAKSFAARGERNRKPSEPINKQELEVELAKLRWVPPAAKLPASTRDIAPGEKQIVGQDRALTSIYWGLKMPGDNYNLYVSGPEGSGRETAVKHILEKLAPEMPTAPDLVAVTNFADTTDPITLELAPGSGVKLEAGVEKFVRVYQMMLPRLLDSPDAHKMRREIKDEFEKGVAERRAALDSEVAQARIGRFGIALIDEDDGQGNVSVQVAPTYQDPGSQEWKTVGSPEELEKLVAAGAFTKAEFNAAVKQAQEAAKPFFEKYEAMQRENGEQAQAANEAVDKVNGTVAAGLVKHLAPELLGAVSRNTHDTPEHKEFDKRSAKLQKDFSAELAKLRFAGGYGVALVPNGQGGVGAIITKEEGGERVQADPSQVPADVMAEVQKALPAISAKFNALKQTIETEHQAVHAKDPPPVPGEKKAVAWVSTMLKHAAANWAVFLPQSDEKRQKLDPAELYVVSVLRDNAGQKGGRVIYENAPSFERLFGSADGKKVMLIPGVGAVRTNSPGGPKLKGGSYLAADVLVLNVMDVLRAPGVWPALMQMRRNGTADIIEDGIGGYASARGESYQVAHRPKIVLIGSPMIRMLLKQHDEEFARSFNATAEFEPSLNNGEESIAGYLQFMKKVILQSGGLAIDMTRDAISALLEFSAREAGSNTKLSAQFGALYSMMREATLAARMKGRGEVLREDVETALAARRDPDSVHQKRLLELLTQRVFNVETDGAAVGQINGLAVMGDFGVPMRITVTASAGQPGLVSVDREARMTGTSFNKALGVVEGFLQHTFAQKKAIAAHIRISFEQEYGGIDGDSATSTEIYGVLSRLSGVPIKQQYAVTGSADQFGNVQAIGGVNEKIEGVFELVKHRGFVGAPGDPPGVLIPKSNVGDLMLKPEIVQAVREGKFKIYAIEHVSQGIEVLTGVAYADILRKADARLAELRK